MDNATHERLTSEGLTASELSALVAAEEAMGRRHTAAIEGRQARDRQARIDEQRAGLRWDRTHGE